MQEVHVRNQNDQDLLMKELTKRGFKPAPIGKTVIRTFHKGETEEELRNKLREAYDVVMKDDLAEAVRQLKIGRNDPCPCGSSKKFKKCCMWKCE